MMRWHWHMGPTVSKGREKGRVPVWGKVLVAPWPFLFFPSFILFLFLFSFITFAFWLQIDSIQFLKFYKVQHIILNQ
jgi:hypothetical protein